MRFDLQRKSGYNFMGPFEEERDVITYANGLAGELDAVGKVERDGRDTNGQAVRRLSGSDFYGE